MATVSINNRPTITIDPREEGGDKTVIYDPFEIQLIVASFLDPAKVHISQGYKADEIALYPYDPYIPSTVSFVKKVVKEEPEPIPIPYYCDVYTDISRRWELLDI